MMKVKCPNCGFKAEVVDGKCQICDLHLEEQSSLMMKFNSMSSVKIAFLLSGVVFILVFAAVLLYVSYVSKSNASKHNPSEPIPCLVPIEGFLGVKWGDSMEIAAQKLASNGYEIQSIDNLSNTINLKPIVLAGYKTSNSEVGKLLFYSKGFYSGYVFYTPPSYEIETTKEALASIISQKYGPPTSKFSYSNSDFVIWKSNNGCEIILIKTSLILLRYDNKKVMNEDAAIIAAEENKLLLENRHRNAEPQKSLPYSSYSEKPQKKFNPDKLESIDSVPGASDKDLIKFCVNGCSRFASLGSLDWKECVYCCTNDCTKK